MKRTWHIFLILLMVSFCVHGQNQEPQTPEQFYRSGIHYYYGIGGVQFDKPKAQEYIKVAAQRGYKDAIVNIFQYLDCSDALTTLRACADSGHVLAYNVLSEEFSPNCVQKHNCVEGDSILCHQYAKKSAEKKNAEGMYLYGMCLFDGIGTTKDIQEGESWITRAAENGNIVAMRFLAEMNKKGLYGHWISHPQHKHWLKKAALAGDPKSQYEYGLLMYESEDKNEAFYWMQKAAEQQYKEAFFYMAMLCFEGTDKYPVDKDMAIRWCKEDVAAFANPICDDYEEDFYYAQYDDPYDACTQLSFIYLDDEDSCITADFKKGYNLLKIAAEHENADGEYWYGKCFLDGLGTVTDSTKAWLWITKAANHGSLQGIELLSRYYQWKGDDDSERYWLRKGVELGSPSLMHQYAGRILIGGLEAFGDNPIELLKESANKHYEEAFYTLSAFYYIGWGNKVQQSYNEAEKWCRLGLSEFGNEKYKLLLTEILRDNGSLTSNERLSLLNDLSEEGNLTATAEMAFLHVTELIPKANPKWGIETLEKLYEENNPRAMFYYGFFLLTGKHVRQRMHLGITLIRNAAKTNDIRALRELEKAEKFYQKYKY